jgi:hypothetical protein
MKIRNGFVSNSSSSSFVVAVKDTTKIKLEIDVDLADYADKIIATEQELKDYFEYEYGDDYLEDSWAADKFKDCLRAIEAGNKVIFGSCDSDGEALEQFLCETGIPDSPDIEVIQGDGGY